MFFPKSIACALFGFANAQLSLAQCTTNIVYYSNDVDGLAQCVNDNANVPTPMLSVVNGALHAPTCAQGYVASNFQPSGTYNSAGRAVRLSVSPNEGYQLNVFEISVMLKKSPIGWPEGPATVRLAYSTDNGTTWTDEGSNHFLISDNFGCASPGLTYTWNVPDFNTPNTLLVHIYGLAAPYPLGEIYVRNFSVVGVVVPYGNWGCTDAAACNYDPEATFNDGSCTLYGCTDEAACNYEPQATCEDYSCYYVNQPCNDGNDATTNDVWINCQTCYGIAVQESPYNGFSVTEIPIPAPLIPTIDGALPINGAGDPRCWQIRICLNDPDWELRTIYGGAGNPNWIMATTTSFYQHVFGDVMASGVNPVLFPFIPEMEFDSWFTIGDGYGSSVNTGSLPPDAGSALQIWDNSGLNLNEGSVTGSAIFGLWTNPNSQGEPDENNSILIAQITTDGVFNAQFNLQFRKLNPDGTLYLPVTAVYETGIVIDGTPGVPPVGCQLSAGCMDVSACNFEQQADVDDGSCTYPGCMDENACNYNPDAGCSDDSCIHAGCTDPFAVNYDEDSGCDDGSCIYTGCMGDLNPDGVINVTDLLIFVSQFGDCSGGNCTADLNDDDAVNTSDFLIFASVFGNTCSAPE